MNGLQNMFGQQYAVPDGSASMGDYAQEGDMVGMDPIQMDASMMNTAQSQTLDQIISANNQEMLRRRQTIHPHYQSMSPQQQQQQQQQNQQGQQQRRRASMMEFGSMNTSDLADFQFDPNPQQSTMSSPAGNMLSSQKVASGQPLSQRDDLTLVTQFAQLPNFDNSATGYSSAMMSNSAMSLDTASTFMPHTMDMTADFSGMQPTIGPMNMSNNPNQQPIYSTSPVNTSFPLHMQPTNHDPGGGSASPQNGPTPRLTHTNSSSSSSPQRFMGKPQSQLRRNPVMPSPLSMSTQSPMGASMPSSTPTQQQRSRRASMDMPTPYMNGQPAGNMQFSVEAFPQFPGAVAGSGMGVDAGQLPAQPLSSRYSNAYSTTGFDMLGVLMRVASRQNPQINIGPVDLSCAFVVCDVNQHDLPIVYCSDMFERLTGYSRHEILGRNCRFLQAPDGRVQSGIKRKYVDDKSVLYLKNQINRRAEAQLSLINYRKGGQPFMNLLTMIPVTWDNEEIRYYVGFQVDLVEQPNSVSAKNPDGTYEINYNRSALPAYRLPAPDPNSGLENMGGQSISRDEVSQVLATIGNGETDLSRRIWDKILLENADDVVHVLSLKGLFLYLSPACKNILEYEPSELVGTALSAVCHPSDIVPVTRELKDSSNGASVNVIYRIRRKTSGYTWFEAHGCLHTEQGKGRKCIILVGRPRPVYTMDRNELAASENAGDAELWSKMSTTGMFLYVSSASRSMLDRVPEDLVGTSVQSIMRPESRKEFGRVLELARLGEKSTFKHDMQNRRGQVLQAQTTIYPGDAKKGFKPTFLLAQTRLLKMTRAMLMSQKGSSIPRSDESSGFQTPNTGNGTENTNAMSVSINMTSPATKTQFVGSSGILTQAGSGGVPIGSQDEALASEDNIFDELKTTRSTSWQFELRQMERQNRLLTEDLQTLLSRKKKRKRRKGMGNLEKDCANCHTRVTPEWRRGPSGQRDLCNSCGLRWAKQTGRVSPRKGSARSEKSGTSPTHASQSNVLTNKESSADSKATNKTSLASGTAANDSGITLVKDEHSSSPALNQAESGREDSERGNMPPVIEEGQEPPHRDVLPT